MKPLGAALAVVVSCVLAGNLSLAEAASYTFTIVNKLNAYIPSKELNADAVYRVPQGHGVAV